MPSSKSAQVYPELRREELVAHLAGRIAAVELVAMAESAISAVAPALRVPILQACASVMHSCADILHGAKPQIHCGELVAHHSRRLAAVELVAIAESAVQAVAPAHRAAILQARAGSSARIPQIRLSTTMNSGYTAESW